MSAGSTAGHSVLAPRDHFPLSTTRGIERAVGNRELHELSAAQVRPDDDALARPVAVQHQNFKRVAKLAMVELVVADAVQAHRRSGVTRKQRAEPISRPSANGERRPSLRDGLRSPVGQAHEAAGWVRL